MEVRDEETDGEGIRRMIERMADAVNRGALDEWRRMWHPEARQLAPEAPIVSGRAGILYGAEAWLRDWRHDLQVRCEEVQAAGAWGFACGTLSLRSVHRSRGEVRYLDGKFLAVLARNGPGSWQLYRWCHSSSVPAPFDRGRAAGSR